jgi:NADPH:quinone reductase-like Zn-dependent oxidoreductase
MSQTSERSNSELFHKILAVKKSKHVAATNSIPQSLFDHVDAALMFKGKKKTVEFIIMANKTGKVVLFMGVGEPLEERRFPLPKVLDPGAILVKTGVATVCGSDMHSWRGRRPFPFPSVLGHEGVGTIVQLGANVKQDTSGKTLAEGDRITWAIMANCGDCCFCRVYALPQKCLNLFKYGHEKS